MKHQNIYSFNSDHVGLLIAQSKWDECWDYMGGVIQNLTMNAGPTAQAFSMQLQKDMQDEDKKHYVKEFGALLGELFLFLLTTPEVGMSDKSFEHLIPYHETLHTLFYIYDMDHTDEHVEKMLSSQKNLPPKQQKKLLLLLSLNTNLDINGILKKMDPGLSTPAIIAYLGHRKIFKKKIYDNKIKLHELGRNLHRAYKPVRTFVSLVHAYFLTSYLNFPGKHKIKEDINAAARQYLNQMGKELKNAKSSPSYHDFKINKEKPTALVIHEYYSPGHAMVRGWGMLIKSMESEFNVVMTSPGDPKDKKRITGENFFHFNTAVALFDLIYALKPDIIFMPSIGMKIYNIIASNTRSAPIQIMGLGHPATTMSEYIDYVVSPSGLYDPAAFPKDTYIADGYPEKHIPLLTKDVFFAPLAQEEIPNRTKDGRRMLEVCVVGTDIKVSAPFFSLLKEIIAGSPYDIHITFMLGVGGIDSLYIEKYLRENFENCTYHGWQAYTNYINNLKKADIVLNPFPFGHTNTIIDTLMCGKPCIGLEGVEPSAKTESDILHAVGLDHLFVAKSEEDYKQKFLYLAERIMKGEKEFFDRDKVYDRIYGGLGDYDYGKVIKWIYDHHKELKASKKNYYEVFKDIQAD